MSLINSNQTRKIKVNIPKIVVEGKEDQFSMQVKVSFKIVKISKLKNGEIL